MSKSDAPAGTPAAIALQTLPYERFNEESLVRAIRLFDGERLLVLQPFGWHIDGKHIPNAVEHFSREWVCEEHKWEVVCDYGPYVAVVRAALAALPAEKEQEPMTAKMLERAKLADAVFEKTPHPGEVQRASLSAPGETAETPPLLAYLNATTTPERDVAYLRLYAEKVRNRTEMTWEIPNTRASVLLDIASRFEQQRVERDRETELRRAAERHNTELRAALMEKPYPDEYDSLERRCEQQQAEIARLRGELDAANQHVKILQALAASKYQNEGA
jgi:hypothetical protein